MASASYAHLSDLMSAYAIATPVTTVAVVGNAPLEPDSTRAEAIDGADLVIRVNGFVLDRPGDAQCQGSRADVVVWNRITRATPFLFADYSRRLYLLAEPMRMHGRPEAWPESWPPDLGFVPVPNDVVADLNTLLDVPWQTEEVAPTTGMLASFLAFATFPEARIRLAGLSFVDDPYQTEWRHQAGDSCAVGPEHRLAAEAGVARSWLETGRVEFYR